MATVRGILVKQFGGPEVLEYVTNIVQPSKPAARQVLFHNSFELFIQFVYYVYQQSVATLVAITGVLSG